MSSTFSFTSLLISRMPLIFCLLNCVSCCFCLSWFFGY
jgi:hypothetical protein